jgi:hypothetical protein
MPSERSGLAPSTVDRRLSTVCGYYRLRAHRRRIASNAAQFVRRQRGHPSTQRGMDRGELASFLFTAERTSPMHAALAVLFGLNGLRVSEACGADVEDLGFERGRRILQIVGTGNKPAGVPLRPRAARTIDLAIGERRAGPILIRDDGQRLDSCTASRWVRSVGEQAGQDHVHPHMLRAGFIVAALDAGVVLRDVQVVARHADTDDHRLRPAMPVRRPTRRLRCRRVRHQRLSLGWADAGLPIRPVSQRVPLGRSARCRRRQGCVEVVDPVIIASARSTRSLTMRSATRSASSSSTTSRCSSAPTTPAASSRSASSSPKASSSSCVPCPPDPSL